MIVQSCIKGLGGLTDDEAIHIVASGVGLTCQWWRRVDTLWVKEIPERLTADSLDRHVNHFDTVDPTTNLPFSAQSPFISLSAGCVERTTFLATNIAHRARRVALEFATRFGQEPVGHLFYCWVVLPTRPALEVEFVAEEIRDLNSYRRYSAYQTEGEVTAKIHVPAAHIERVERWQLVAQHGSESWTSTCLHENPNFIPAERLSNLRELV